MVSAIESEIYAWALLLVVPVLCFLIANDRKLLFLILIGAWVGRVVLALTHNYLMDLPETQFDAQNFQAWAYQGAQSGLSGAVEHFRTGAYIYPSLVSFVFVLLGPSQLLMQAINVALGVAIVFLTYRLSFLLWGNEKGALLTALVTAFWPSLMLYSSITMREAPVVIFMMFSVIHAVQWVDRQKILNGVAAVLFMFVAMLFHTGMAAGMLALGVIGLGVLVRAYLRLPKSLYFVKLTPLLLFGVVIVVTVIVTGIGLEKIRGGIVDLGIEVLATQQENVAQSRARYLDTLIVTSWADLALHAPIRIVYFLFSPMPWDISGGADLFGFFDAFLYFALTLLLIFNLRILKSKGGLTVFVFLLVSIYVFSFVTSNSGSALRHRGKFAPIMICLVLPYALSRRQNFSVQILDKPSRHAAE